MMDILGQQRELLHFGRVDRGDRDIPDVAERTWIALAFSCDNDEINTWVIITLLELALVFRTFTTECLQAESGTLGS